MPKGNHKFTKGQIQQLSANKIVRMVSETTISFHEEFSRRYYSERMDGKRPADIFRENGIDPEILGNEKYKRDIHFSFGNRANFMLPIIRYAHGAITWFIQKNRIMFGIRKTLMIGICIGNPIQVFRRGFQGSVLPAALFL